MRFNYGWVIVAAGALMTCVAFGAVFSLAVFLQSMSDATGWSRAGISGAMTLVFLAMGVGGFAWGTLSDRIGARPVVLAGSVLLALGLALASRAGSLLEFQLAYGLLVGFAAGSFFPPFIAVVSNWFDRRRALAVSLTTMGVGVAPMTVSPFASWLLTVQDWRGAQMTIAQRAAIVSCAPRQSVVVSSQLANGETIIGAMPTPAEVSDTASARWRSNQLLTTAMNGGKKLPAAKPTISP